MPLSLVLIVVGILLICAAYYLPAIPSPIHSLLMFLGVAALCIGVIVLVYGLIVGAAGVHLAMSAVPLADAYWERSFG